MLDRPDDHALDGGAEHERDQQGQDEGRPVGHVVHQRPGDEGREHRHLTLGEVEDVGRAVDEDESQREAREDRALREAADDLLHVPDHVKASSV